MTGSKLGQFCSAESYVPRGLLLQWHVTERCNLRCAHCYQDSYGGDDLQFPQLLQILEQYKRLLSRWRSEANDRRVRGHITVTGGEPFVRRDFLDLLNVFWANRRQFSFAILTNGSFIDKSMARRLRRLAPAFVQVSIEGTKTTHDAIRGQGDFSKTVVAIEHLVRARIRTLVSFTANRLNFREFPQVADLGRELRVARVWADRLIPRGVGANLREQTLTPEETHEFFHIMRQTRADTLRRCSKRTEIAMHRALQHLVTGEKPYHCAAGDTLITVQPNGDVYPCRRMPICVGNLMTTPLDQLYYTSDTFRALRDRHRISEGCEDCLLSKLCRGGLKCLSYAVAGDPFQGDPGCWIKDGPHAVETTGSMLGDSNV